jgi:penicillin-binding protein 1A
VPHKALILHPIVGGREANLMQSREPSQRNNEGVQQVGPPERHALSAILTTLAIPALVKMLAKRIVVSVNDADLPGAILRVRSHMRARVKSITVERARAAATATAGNLLHRITNMLRNGRRPLSKLSLPGRRVPTLVVLIVFVPATYVAYCIATIPFARGAATQPVPSAIIFAAENGRPLATRGILKGENISADRIPPLLASAVTAIEDRRFYQHNGVDFRAMMRAAWHDLTGRRLEGGSTITQQLARRLYLSTRRTVRRKLQEAALAIWLELRLSKNEIFARYLNSTYFGDGAYGVSSAALRYFGKSAQELSLTEAAMLAGLIRAPSELAPDHHLARAQARAGVVLNAMVDTGAITQRQANVAQAQPATLRRRAESQAGDNYFLDTAAAEAKSRVDPSTEDLTVRTTLNPELQRIAEGVIAKRLSKGGRANVSQAALVAIAPDGAILAMVGGRDYNGSQFNRVTQARRQTGSLFKAFVYLAALRKGYTPDSIVVDQPFDVGDWEPENYGNHYYGPVTLRTAFAHSLNSVAVQLAQAVGIQTVIDTARQLGVRSDLPALPSVALGSGALTPLEMTRAFAAIATNTAKVDSYSVREITNGDRTVYRKSEPRLDPVDNPLIHSEMLDLLTSVVRNGTGAAARLDRPVGGKTGTSQDYRDAWFVGFTSDLVVGVWVGNDDNAPMSGVVGGSIPASIWHDFVSAAEPLQPSPTAPVSAMGGSPSAPTISFSGIGAASGKTMERSGYSSGYGLRLPFRLFGFRF